MRSGRLVLIASATILLSRHRQGRLQVVVAGNVTAFPARAQTPARARLDRAEGARRQAGRRSVPAGPALALPTGGAISRSIPGTPSPRRAARGPLRRHGRQARAVRSGDAPSWARARFASPGH